MKTSLSALFAILLVTSVSFAKPASAKSTPAKRAGLNCVLTVQDAKSGGTWPTQLAEWKIMSQDVEKQSQIDPSFPLGTPIDYPVYQGPDLQAEVSVSRIGIGSGLNIILTVDLQAGGSNVKTNATILMDERYTVAPVTFEANQKIYQIVCGSL